MLDFTQILIILFFRHFKDQIYQLRTPKLWKLLALVFALFAPLFYLQISRIYSAINAQPNYYKLLKTSRSQPPTSAESTFLDELSKFTMVAAPLAQPPIDPAILEEFILNSREKEYSFFNKTIAQFPQLNPDAIQGLDILSQGAKCLNSVICRQKHDHFGKGMDQPLDLADYGVPQTLGLLVVMGINVYSSDPGDRSARLGFVIVFLIGIFEFQLKALGEVEYNFMDLILSKNMTYNEGFLIIKGVFILVYMLLGAVERLISIPYETMRYYFYQKLARLNFMIAIGHRALKTREICQKSDQERQKMKQKMDIENLVGDDQQLKRLLRTATSNVLLTKPQAMAIDTNF